MRKARFGSSSIAIPALRVSTAAKKSNDCERACAEKHTYRSKYVNDLRLTRCPKGTRATRVCSTKSLRLAQLPHPTTRKRARNLPRPDGFVRWASSPGSSCLASRSSAASRGTHTHTHGIKPTLGDILKLTTSAHFNFVCSTPYPTRGTCRSILDTAKMSPHVRSGISPKTPRQTSQPLLRKSYGTPGPSSRPPRAPLVASRRPAQTQVLIQILPRRELNNPLVFSREMLASFWGPPNTSPTSNSPAAFQNWEYCAPGAGGEIMWQIRRSAHKRAS